MGFERTDGALSAEGVALAEIAEAVGTPAYVYSAGVLRDRYRRYARAFAWSRGLVAYAVKANGSLAVLKVLAGEGAGADTVSAGEIARALKAGVPPERIAFSGMGKTDEELAFALELPGLQINVESVPEYGRLAALARARGVSPLVAVRVNPDVEAGGHAKIATGKSTDKFGIPEAEALALYRRARQEGVVSPVGLACHIGSQILQAAPFRQAWERLRRMTLELRAAGAPVTRVDLGGGLGVAYEPGATPPGPEALGALAEEIFAGLDVEVSVEPGRSIAGPAGVLVARVVHLNARSDGRTFLVLDAGMNDLIRPALYDAHHELVPLHDPAGEPRPYDLVGPVCETGDTFARGRRLPPLEAGDLVAFLDAGAYAASMASEYNARLPAPEVLIDSGRWAVTRPRPRIEDVLARETLPDWL